MNIEKRIILVCVVVALGVALAIRAFQQPVQPSRLAELKPGMTKTEVEAVLGKPTKVYASGQWTYRRPLVFGFVNVHWQEDGTYDGEYNYERF